MSAQKSHAVTVPAERISFKRLLIENPNYFGNLVESKFPPVIKIISDTNFEDIDCVGYNPDSQNLEATIAIHQATGYNGDLCHTGSTEYVRFFLDYGSGFEDAGYTGVQVHDIANGNDCSGATQKPLAFTATLKYDKPKSNCCTHPVLPRVRAILSWNSIPPAGNANWQPVWGDVHECNVQIKPSPFSIFCLLEELGGNIELPPKYKALGKIPIPIPDPGPLTLAQVASHYALKAEKSAALKPGQTQQFSVPSHRFAAPFIQPLLRKSSYDPKLVETKSIELKASGIDLAALLKALEETSADTAFEELECLGLDENFPEKLVATFRIKQGSGYSGSLCTAGSTEYVAFWADWNNTCQWTYLGTAAVKVHDFGAGLPQAGLCYSATLPVDLTDYRRTCSEPKIARVRAVLSWATPPSSSDANQLDFWGNRLDRHVIINPGPGSDPADPAIRNIGNIPVEDIDASGLTTSTAIFADFPWISADQWGLGRPCPFGGRIRIDGDFFLGYWYRVKVKRVADPPASFTVLTTPFDVEKDPAGFDHQTATGGFFPYLDPATHFNRILAVWDSVGDDQWEVQLDVATGPAEADIIGSSPWYVVQLDNTAPAGPPALSPTMDIHISMGGDCKDVKQGDVIHGTFLADDLYFGGWELSTEPNTFTTPSNQPTSNPFLASTDAAPGPAGHGWQLDTANPIKMKTCGYVVRLDVSDRSIVGSYPGSHNSNNIEVGFCLRAATTAK